MKLERVITKKKSTSFIQITCNVNERWWWWWIHLIQFLTTKWNMLCMCWAKRKLNLISSKNSTMNNEKLCYRFHVSELTCKAVVFHLYISLSTATSTIKTEENHKKITCLRLNWTFFFFALREIIFYFHLRKETYKFSILKAMESEWLWMSMKVVTLRFRVQTLVDVNVVHSSDDDDVDVEE